MLLDECSCQTTTVCLCLARLMYFALMQVNSQTEELILLLSDGWSQEMSVVLKTRSSENIVAPYTAVRQCPRTLKRFFPIQKYIILFIIKCSTHRFRIKILREYVCVRAANMDSKDRLRSPLFFHFFYFELICPPCFAIWSRHQEISFVFFSQQLMVLSYISYFFFYTFFLLSVVF